MSLRESINSINSPYKPPKKRCEEGTPTTQWPQDIQKDMARVIGQLDRLQASIDQLLAMCLREGLEDSSGVEVE